MSNYSAFRFGFVPISSPESQAIRSFPIISLSVIVCAWFYSRGHIFILCLILLLTQILQNFAFHGLYHHAFFHTAVIAVSQFAMFLIMGIMIEIIVSSIRQKQLALKQLNRRLILQANTQQQLAISQERNRMARELHDTLAHTLSGLIVQLETVTAYWQVEPDTAADMLGRSLATARNGLQETRRSLQALRAGPLEDLGLLQALQQLVDTATDQTGLESAVDFPKEAPALDPEIDQCIFRIVQEAVANIVSHARASRLTLKLSIEQDRIELILSDNGVGFDAGFQEKQGHFGIAGMKERAELVGGKLEIRSTPGSGTTICFTGPIENQTPI